MRNPECRDQFGRVMKWRLHPLPLLLAKPPLPPTIRGMNRKRLGRSGIVVTDICMGTMTFGLQADEKTSFAIMDRAMDAGVDFFDTAEVYPVPPSAEKCGVTEEIVG